jgi:hypothetical protein
MRSPIGLVVTIVLKNRVTYGDALVTDVGSGVIAGGGNELPNYILALVAERTTEGVVASGSLHKLSPGEGVHPRFIPLEIPIAPL